MRKWRTYAEQFDEKVKKLLGFGVLEKGVVEAAILWVIDSITI